PHRNPPLPPQIQQPKTAGANLKLDKTWGQGHFQRLLSRSPQKHQPKSFRHLHRAEMIGSVLFEFYRQGSPSD
ncbi:hypothetical protein, partial [Rhizobium sp. BK661]